MTPPTANPSQAVSPSHHGEKLSEACGAEAENDGSLSALTTATAFEEVKGEGWISFWLFVWFFYWEDWRGRISTSCWIFLNFYLWGDVVISTSSWSSLSPFYLGKWFLNLTVNTFFFLKLASNNWPYLEPPFFSVVSLTPGFFQAGSPGNAQSYGCCIAGMPRSDSPEWFWDTSMAIGRSAEDEFFFFCDKFPWIPTAFFSEFGNMFRNQKKTHTKKECIFFFRIWGGKIKHTTKFIHHLWFRRYYHWDGFFLVDIFAKITTIIPTIWDH